MSRRLKTTFAAVLAAGIGAWAVSAGARQAAPAAPLALDEIRADHLAAHTRFLSSDLLEGRAPSSRGGQLAAEYIGTQFALAGLEPGAGTDSWFQEVPIVESRVDPAMELTASGPDGRLTLQYLEEIVAFAGAQEPVVRVSGDVVFVGYGINAPEANWNDYAGVDVRGKVVLALVNDPPAPPSEPDLFGGGALTYYGRWTYKYEEAARQGAAGAILVHTAESAGYPFQVVQTSWSGTQYALPNEAGQPVLPFKAWVTEDAARRLTALGGSTLDSLRDAAARRGFEPVPLNVTVSATLRQTVSRRTSPNVIGRLPGTRTDQAVVYTAHYDHFGIREAAADQPADADLIFNGALDNATGVAGMLEIAQAFTRAAEPPGRTMYFVATTAEESGLLGADWFARHPPLPLDQIAANINVDGLNVLGPARDLVLLGAERSTLGEMAERLTSRHDRVLGVDPEPNQGYFFRSDHFPLAKGGVPAVSISDSTEIIGQPAGFAARWRAEYNAKHYHQPSDEYDPAWNLNGAVADLRLLAELGWIVAASPQPPSYHPDEQFARPRSGGE